MFTKGPVRKMVNNLMKAWMITWVKFAAVSLDSKRNVGLDKRFENGRRSHMKTGI